MLKPLLVVSLLLGALVLSGCLNDPYATSSDMIISSNRAAANNLIRMAGKEIQPGANIIAASFANID